MRKSGKVFLWPLYFEASIPRKSGRRVPKNLSLNGVNIKEIMKAAEDLGLRFEVELNAAHPSQPWNRSGVVLMDKPRSKHVLLRLVAEKMRENRSSGGISQEKLTRLISEFEV
jgi:signal recognition particle subunit SRP19